VKGLNKFCEKMEYVTVRLNTVGIAGPEEIFGKVVSIDEDNNFITLTKTRQLILQQDRSGKIVASLQPWVQGNMDGTVFLTTKSIVGIAEMGNDVKSDYISATTGIALVK